MRELIEHPAWPLGNILDLRPTARFRAGHWRGAVSLPLEESADWPGPDGLQGAYLDAALPSIFLPPRHQPLVVVASAPATARAVCELLARRGRSGLLPLASAAGAEADLPASLSARRGAGARCTVTGIKRPWLSTPPRCQSARSRS